MSSADADVGAEADHGAAKEDIGQGVGEFLLDGEDDFRADRAGLGVEDFQQIRGTVGHRQDHVGPCAIDTQKMVDGAR